MPPSTQGQYQTVPANKFQNLFSNQVSNECATKKQNENSAKKFFIKTKVARLKNTAMEIVHRTNTSLLDTDSTGMIYDKKVTPESKASYSIDNTQQADKLNDRDLPNRIGSGSITREEEMRLRRGKKQHQTFIPLKNLKLTSMDSDKAQQGV